MEPKTRRDFLADVGKGMLTASIGTGLASGLGLSTALAEESKTAALQFGRLEPLVELMQVNTAEQVLPLVVERLAHGTEMRDIVAAAALANARTFGGEDYIGFHAFMALAPAFAMTKEVAAERRALPVLKVLYRSVAEIQARGGRKSEVLHPMETPSAATSSGGGERLRDLARVGDLNGAEELFAGMVSHSPIEAFNEMQAMVQDDTDVHRVVLAYRAWDLLGLTGKEYAHTTLRQSVHYCATVEKSRISHGYPEPGIRAVLPKVLDKYPLSGRKPGTRTADDRWIAMMRDTLLESTGAQAADAVAAALAEGFSLDSVGEALSLTATQQVLRDTGRAGNKIQPGKPLGSVHGDSPGVHASDSMNAWRNIAKASNPANALTGLIVAAYHLSTAQHLDWKNLKPYPLAVSGAKARSQDAPTLLRELDEAIRANDQAHATAVVQSYGDLGFNARPVFDLLLGFAISEDGSLHAEKYYRTVAEEFGRTRKTYRWDHVVALARVTASEYGKRAAGYEQACGLLRVKA
ncbi:MAG: hypothetical protein JWN14_4499 [Chthonomonadales bacterium]|nr:hypothetical protein [Chthonomonadales bacterium]